MFPHAFHWNLPAPHNASSASSGDDSKNVPYLTKFAHAKTRAIVQLCHSIQLSASLFEHQQEQRHDDADNNQEEAIKLHHQRNNKHLNPLRRHRP